MLICIRRSKHYCSNFNSSNAAVWSYLIPAYTVRLAIINMTELERNGCFSSSYGGMLCRHWKEHRQKACKYNLFPDMIQRMLKRKVWKGVQICEGGSISACGFGPEESVSGLLKSCRNVKVVPECLSRAGMFKSCRKVKLFIQLSPKFYLLEPFIHSL